MKKKMMKKSSSYRAATIKPGPKATMYGKDMTTSMGKGTPYKSRPASPYKSKTFSRAYRD